MTRARQSVYVYGPYDTEAPFIEGIAHPRRELTCTRGEWNDSPGKRYVLSYQWRRNNQPIPGADGPDHIVVAEDVGTSLNCAVTAEGMHTATSWWVYPSWEPLRLTLLPDLDATAPSVQRVHAAAAQRQPGAGRSSTQLELTMPGGFSYRPDTTSGALTTNPATTGAGSLTLRWTDDFTCRRSATPSSGSACGPARRSATTSPRRAPTRRARLVHAPRRPTAPRRVTIEGGACRRRVHDQRHRRQRRAHGHARQRRDLRPRRRRHHPGPRRQRRALGRHRRRPHRRRRRQRQRCAAATAPTCSTARPAPTSCAAAAARHRHLRHPHRAGRRHRRRRARATTARTARPTRSPATSRSSAAAAATTTLAGGPGPEELYGRAGNDILDGGDGAGDLLDGGDGDDALTDDDRLVDRVFCGGGWDRYNADLLDRIVGCELPFAIGGGS